MAMGRSLKPVQKHILAGAFFFVIISAVVRPLNVLFLLFILICFGLEKAGVGVVGHLTSRAHAIEVVFAACALLTGGALGWAFYRWKNRRRNPEA